MKSPIKIITLITASAAAVALLAGCTAAPQDVQPAPTAKPAVPVEVIEEITAEQLAADTAAGDTVTAEQAAELNRSDLGVRAWEMADGTFVAVREDAVTPDVVVADVEVRAAEAISTVDPAVALTTSGSNSNTGVVGDADRFVNQTQRELGKKVMAVFQMYTYMPDEDPSTASLRWKIRNNVMLQADGAIRGETLEQAVARAEGMIAGYDNPSDWIVVVKP
jgi:lipoprotein-anchoring transpeptidase ErfK/SrfK